MVFKAGFPGLHARSKHASRGRDEFPIYSLNDIHIVWRSDGASQCYIKSEAGKQGQHNLQRVTLEHLFLALGFDCHLVFCTFFFFVQVALPKQYI